MAEDNAMALMRRADMLYAIIKVADCFFKESDWDKGVNQAIKRIGKAMGVSRVYIFKIDTDESGRAATSQKYEWADIGISQEINNTTLQKLSLEETGFSRWVEAFKRGESISGNVRDFPESEKPLLKSQRIISLATCPIFVKGTPWGFVGLDECIREREFSPFDLEALEAFAATIGSALEWKESNKKLEEERKLETLIFDNLSELIMLQDHEHRILYANKPALKNIGVNLPYLIGKVCYEIIYKRSNPCEGCPVDKAIHSGKTEEQEIQTPNGRWWFGVGVPIINEEGKFDKIIDVSLDITEQRKIEQRFKAIFENTAIGLVISDKDKNIIDTNHVFLQMIGYSKEELLRMKWSDYTYSDDLAKDVELHDRLVKREIESYKQEKRYIRKDGTTFWVRMTVSSIIKDEKGNFLYDVAAVEDITDIKKKEEEIKCLISSQILMREIANMILRAEDENAFLQGVCGKITGLDFVKFVWVGLKVPNSFKIKPVSSAGFEDGYLKSIKVTIDDSEQGKGPTRLAIKTNRPVVVNDIETDPIFEPWRKKALKRGYESTIALPLIYSDEVIGSLNVFSHKKNAFGKEEIDLLNEIAQDMSIGINRLRLIIHRGRMWISKK